MRLRRAAVVAVAAAGRLIVPILLCCMCVCMCSRRVRRLATINFVNDLFLLF